MGKLFAFELRQKVKDKWSPFTGIVMARTQYISGCNTYAVFDQKLDTTGKPNEWKWYDETGLEDCPADKERHGGPCNPSAPGR